MRGNSAPVNELGNLSFYCRSCGRVMKQADMPIVCSTCGSILIDSGFGISGDNALSETSTMSGIRGQPQILDIDKKVH